MDLIEEVDRKINAQLYDIEKNYADDELELFIGDINDVRLEDGKMKLFLLKLLNNNVEMCDKIINNDVALEFAQILFDKYEKTAKFGGLKKKYFELFDELISYPAIKQYMYCYEFYNVISLRDLLDYYDTYFFEKRTVSYIKINLDEYYEFFDLMQTFVVLKNKYESEKLSCRRAVKQFGRLCNDLIDSKKMKLDKKIVHGDFISSKLEIKVLDVLNDLMKEYDMVFIYKHRFDFCKFLSELEYDFFCLVLCENKIIPFVIEVDGDQHFKKNNFYDFEVIHTRDIVKQYYLHRLNIHLLRINERTKNIEFVIRDFMYRLTTFNYYLMVNPIVPLREYFDGTDEIYGLMCFCCHCLSMS